MRTASRFARKRYGKIGVAKIKGPMRNILLAIAAATLPVAIAAAEQPNRQRPDPAPTRERLLPVKRDAGAGNSCAAYGPGFVKIEGTGTCVRVGGAVEIGASGSR